MRHGSTPRSGRRAANDESAVITVMQVTCPKHGQAVGLASSRVPIRGSAKGGVTYGRGLTAGHQVNWDGGGNLSGAVRGGLSAEGAVSTSASKICRAVIGGAGLLSPVNWRANGLLP